MRLFEYQAKDLFKDYGILVPESILVEDVDEVKAAVEALGLPCVVKSQVLAGGRGKAGGVAKVNSLDQAEAEATRIFDLPIGGEKPESLLIESAVPHSSEMYLSVTLDRGQRTFVVIASKAGGVEVESLAGKIVRPVKLEGMTEADANEVAVELELSGKQFSEFVDLVTALDRLSREKECELAEINPLAILDDGTLLALDAKVILDDNALFRHPEFSKLHPEDRFEGEASRQGFAFVRLDGDIAVVGNGAGLVLSTLDLVGDAGGRPACFLDLGGGAQKDRVEAALRLVNELPNADRILLNIFGGITRTTDVAEGVLAVSKAGLSKPVYARISGAEEEQAREILSGSTVKLFRTAPEAVASVVAKA